MGKRPDSTTTTADTEVLALKHRVTQLEKRVDGLSALVASLTAPKGPEGPGNTGPLPAAVASPAYPPLPPLPPMVEQPRRGPDYGSLILAQRQFHQQPRSYDVIN